MTEMTYCAHGHPFDEANTYIKPNGSKSCRVCGRESSRKSRQRPAGVPRFKRLPLRERLLGRAIINWETGYWEWAGTRNRDGYGRMGAQTSRGYLKSAFVHRVSYELFVGPIPEGLTLDHLCRNPPCCNPAHLEPVTQRVNNLRAPYHLTRASKTYCVNGHEFTEENTRITKHGYRCCRKCNSEAARKYWAEHPEERQAARIRERVRKPSKKNAGGAS